MTEQDLIELAETQGIEDAEMGRTPHEPSYYTLCDDIKDAYWSAYWHTVAYVLNPAYRWLEGH